MAQVQPMPNKELLSEIEKCNISKKEFDAFYVLMVAIDFIVFKKVQK